MKKSFISLLAVLSISLFLIGCDIDPSQTVVVKNPTLGQQLMDLKKAKDSGAITDSEYQAQKAKFLGEK